MTEEDNILRREVASRFKLATGLRIQSQFQLNSYSLGSSFVPDIVLYMVRNEEDQPIPLCNEVK